MSLLKPARRPALALATTLALALQPAFFQPAAAAEAQRIVALGGTVTEIICALGAGERIAAVDSTSTYPEEAADKPDVGYVRQISPEGVLSQKPDLIVAESGAGPADAIEILKASGVDFVSIPSPPETASIPDKIRAVGAAIGETEKAEALATDVAGKLKAMKEKVASQAGPKKKVLFALSLANGRVMAAGAESSADAIIRLAGGENAVSSISGYKPLTDEAVIAAAPDVVLVMSGGAMHMTAEQAFALPALAASPAGRDKAFITMDGLFLLGLGPRATEAAAELHAKLYPESAKP
jgi:iron complex transport system substrate-binding protein